MDIYVERDKMTPPVSASRARFGRDDHRYYPAELIHPAGVHRSCLSLFAAARPLQRLSRKNLILNHLAITDLLRAAPSIKTAGPSRP